MKAATFKNKHLKKLTNASIAKFKNVHGELFEVYLLDNTVYFSGDETDWYLTNLFNDEFNIWASEELYELGKILVERYKP